MHGQTNKQAEGNEDISHYKNISQPTLADIIKHPDKYIQSIGSYIFYNDFAWLNDKRKKIKKQVSHNAKRRLER
jgi:hypothetical protein